MKIEKLINLDLLTRFFENLKTYFVGATKKVTYDELVALRNAGELVPGMEYRINDFVTKVNYRNVMSAEHPFDVIVTAISENKLDEDAKTALREGDTYFSNHKIETWKIKYCLDNDVNRFNWADTRNGKGVIYYMKDNLNNECGYDFKNVLYKNPIDTTDTKWYYTFTTTPNEDSTLATDDTLIAKKHCYNNIIKPNLSNDRYQLNYIIFDNVAQNNFIDFNCYNIKFGTYAQLNKFDKNCQNNSFGNNCQNNSFGNGCGYNNLEDSCYYNNFETLCRYVVLSNNCCRNTFGISCYNVKLSSVGCYDNIFKQYCEYVELITKDDKSLGYIQKYIVDSGASGISAKEFNTYNVKRGLNNETTITKSSKDEVKEFCVADLIDEAGTQVELVDSTNIENPDYDTMYLVCDRDYSQEYLTFEALEDNFTFQIKNTIEYKIEGDDTWTTLPTGNVSPALNAGQRILLKGNCTVNGRNGIGQFSSKQKFNVMGNAMSLLFGDDFKDKYDLTGYNYAFYCLFAGTLILNAKNLILPATTLADYCYSFMFQACTSLTAAPTLPATTLVPYCYSNMFYQCYSLTTAPELPANELATSCYYMMFQGCTNLNYIKAMFLTEPSRTYTSAWVRGVSSTGIFIKNTAASWNNTGAEGIPEDWNVIEYPCISPAIVNSNDDITFYYNDGLYTPKKKPISLLSIFDYSQMMQLKPECDIEVCILSEGSIVESSYEWKCDMSLNDVIDDLNLYYEDITIVINKVIIESNDAGYYGYYYY